jgi:protein-L-isoaspartate O-methyltransferase
MQIFTATYSPDDNKLRLYASTRLDAETYARAKALGFKWAPKQELFVAPAWSPAREDFLLELAGDIEDEDKSLCERAEERAERFEDYSDKRERDADRARKAVDAIAENIPFGQPILVGHHSERRARKDAERIESGMRKAVNLWRTSQYWQGRAAGAIRAAKYKERADVRHRRIKTIEADLRKCERSKKESETWLRLWTKDGLTLEQGIAIANRCWLHLPRKEGDKPDFDGKPTAYTALTNGHPTLYAPRSLQEVIDHAAKVYPASIAHCERWIEHYQNRLAYERAMLAEQIGAESTADLWAFAPGGKVLIGNEWLTILRVNRSGGVANSLTTTAPAARAAWLSRGKYGVEEVKDYRAPDDETAAKVKAATSLAPLCNYPGEGFAHMTRAQYDKVPKEYKGGRELKKTTYGRHRVRHALGIWAKVDGQTDSTARHSYNAVYLTDAPRKDPPAIEPAAEVDAVAFVREFVAPPERHDAPAPRNGCNGDEFRALESALKEGVKVVSAPQLFPTPVAIAAQMAELANIKPGCLVMEPSAGTGRLISAALAAGAGSVYAVEANYRLVDGLRQSFDSLRYGDAPESGYVVNIHLADFLDLEPRANFNRVIMNPPFENGADIKHIKHAMRFLLPGGRLVALCANGPRQQAQLRPLASEWRELPAGSFLESGTSVNVAMLAIDAPASTETNDALAFEAESP